MAKKKDWDVVAQITELENELAEITDRYENLKLRFYEKEQALGDALRKVLMLETANKRLMDDYDKLRNSL